jgi:hypothetical protein
MAGVVRAEELDLDPLGVADLNWEVVAAGDFNGDGDDDLIWQHRLSQRLVMWLMAGEARTCGAFLDPFVLDLPEWGAWKVVGPR